MSWNGSIPRPCTKSKGVRNKRNKKSIKAIIARQHSQARRAQKKGFGHGSGQDYGAFDV